MVVTRLRAAVMESGEAVWADAIDDENSIRDAITKRRRAMVSSGRQLRSRPSVPAERGLVQSSDRREILAQALIDHQAARQLQFAQSARDEPLGRRMDIAPRSQFEIVQRGVAGFERGEETGQAHRRV